ncbi:MAG: ABC-F family ATP-binding cassette domain-containing protein [Desulfobacterales bacterium]|nr:ABC-F family ATP-binding cassette domain-containing protein [Desulfobacterales bacterium]
MHGTIRNIDIQPPVHYDTHHISFSATPELRAGCTSDRWNQIMISIENLSKGFAGHMLFDKAGFQINSRERVGLVGRNGHGKTTLFRIITGLEEPDEGVIHIPKNYRIGHVLQHLRFTKPTVLEEGMTGLPEAASDQAWKVEKILAGLGFSLLDMTRHPSEFSGGFQVRLNLAKVLVAEPDLLLLDEPTNYLDITSIRWIERFLVSWPHELMLITHDRNFMDKVVTHTLGIHRNKMRKIKGDTEKYYNQIAQDEEIYEKTRANDEKRKKEIELFISRFRAKARLANMVQSRVKTLSKMEKRDKLENIKALDFSFRYEPFPAKQVLRVDNLAFGYDLKSPLFQKLSFSVGARERVCIIGKNGKGKTTLIKLLAGALPQQQGDIGYHPVAVKGFYEQTNVDSLRDARTVEEEILYAAPQVERQLARNIAGAMMFEGDNALKKISVLSGGEKSRVMLGKLLVTPTNVLLLDEPTNHLDMDSCDALLSALDSFPGALIMVTHNEMFLHALAEKLIVFQNEGVSVFDGGYQRFLEYKGWEGEDPPAGLSAPANAAEPAIKLNRKELRRRRSEILTERAKVVKPIEKKIEAAENEIDANEKKLLTLNEEMLLASQTGDGEKIAKLSQTLHACQTVIERRFDELEKLSEELDAKAKPFDEQLKAFEEAAEIGQ